MTSHALPDRLAVREVPDPEPGAGEVLVEVHAVSLNRGELRLVAQRDGWRPGQDVAGTVLRAAADGSGPPVGTRVVAWVDQGGWAQYVAAPTDRVAPLPDQVDTAQAATLPVAGVTALRLLRRGGHLLERRVLVTGASGGVGRFAVELAARSGARVTAIASRPERAAGLDDLGAVEVVPSAEEAPGRYHLILESAGGPSLSAMPARLARDGVLVVFGNSSGEPSRIGFRDFVDSPDARLEVFRVYESADRRTRAEDLALLVALVARDALHPHIGLQAPYREAVAALRVLEAREVNGKAVLRFDTNRSQA